MKLTGETKLFIGIAIFTVVLIVGAMVFFSKQATKETVVVSREELIPEGTFTKGNASASAYLVEFSDLQCPACKIFDTTVEAILKEYGDKLVYAYRHYPLTQHPYSTQAAIAAEAAHRQNKFWEIHTEIFADQENLSDEYIQTSAKKIGLDMEQFNTDLKDSKLKDKVANDVVAGNRFGINSTPTFFLNGVKLDLNNPQELQHVVADTVK